MIEREYATKDMDDTDAALKKAIDHIVDAYINPKRVLSVHDRANEAKVDYLDSIPGELYRLMKADIAAVWGLLESPIEQVAIFQLAAINYGAEDWPIYAKVVRQRGKHPHSAYPVQVIPQAVFGRYRVDFLFDLGPIGLAAFECDGAEYHADRNKDARRDRELLEQHGVKVFRITGKEIWRDDASMRMWAEMIRLYLKWGSTTP